MGDMKSVHIEIAIFETRYEASFIVDGKQVAFQERNFFSSYPTSVTTDNLVSTLSQVLPEITEPRYTETKRI